MTSKILRKKYNQCEEIFQSEVREEIRGKVMWESIKQFDLIVSVNATIDQRIILIAHFLVNQNSANYAINKLKRKVEN